MGYNDNGKMYSSKTLGIGSRPKYEKRYLFARDTNYIMTEEGVNLDIEHYFYDRCVYLHEYESKTPNKEGYIGYKDGAVIIAEIYYHTFKDYEKFLDTDGYTLFKIVGNGNLDGIITQLCNDFPFLRPLKKGWIHGKPDFQNLMSKDIGYEQEESKKGKNINS